MNESQRQELHIRFGELLEQQENISAAAVLDYLQQDAATHDAPPTITDRVFDLAYHFHAAADSRGFAYQFMAGELSYRAYASEDAVEFLKRAEDSLQVDASSNLRYRLWERLANSHARLRSFNEALSIYDRAIESAP